MSGEIDPSLRRVLIVLSLLSWALVVAYFATARGHLDITGYAVGRDFVNYWAAGHLAAAGQAADIFRPAAFLAHARALFDPKLPFHFWSYPPTALLFVAPLGLLGYFAGYGLWLGFTFAALLAAAASFLRRRADLLLLAATPAVAVNVILGQNGFLTAALLIGGIALMECRPILAGILFGLLTFKPQLGLLVPVAVIAAWRPAVFASAAATVLVLVLASALAFGLEPWRAFFQDTVPMQLAMMQRGAGPFEWMMPSAFMAARLLGAPPWAAELVQAPFLIGAAVLVWHLYRRRADPLLAGAALMAATFVASPQAFNYDMAPAAAALIVLARARAGSGLGLLIAIAWILPVLMVAFGAIHLPLAPLVLGLVAVAFLRSAAVAPSPAASPQLSRTG